MNITQTPCVNFNARQLPTAVGTDRIRHLILHYTDTANVETARMMLTSPTRPVSVHYMVDVDGTIEQLVDEENRAWHAGQSFWQGDTDINSTSIGIEIVNDGHKAGCPPYPAVQIDAVLELALDICKRRNIHAMNVLAHSDIAPARKIDPGEWFPWEALAARGLGYWPKIGEGQLASPPDLSEAQIRQALIDIGYDPALDTGVLQKAFARHFAPEVFDINCLDAEKIFRARLRAMQDDYLGGVQIM